MTEPSAAAGPSRRVLRIFVLAAAGAQTAFWFYTFRFHCRESNLVREMTSYGADHLKF
jgi:hypothetical protein